MAIDAYSKMKIEAEIINYQYKINKTVMKGFDFMVE
jgi:hypothetical protein